MDKKDFGARIRGRMQLLGLTARQVAEANDVSERTVEEWVYGRYLPALDKLAALAKSLETTPNHLLGFVEADHVANPGVASFRAAVGHARAAADHLVVVSVEATEDGRVTLGVCPAGKTTKPMGRRLIRFRRSEADVQNTKKGRR